MIDISPVKSFPYLTIIPTRSPMQKAHTNIGHAKNALTGANEDSHGVKGQMYEWKDDAWRLLYTVTVEDPKPWGETEAHLRAMERKRVRAETWERLKNEETVAKLRAEGYTVIPPEGDSI
jgi:hypothetical protein